MFEIKYLDVSAMTSGKSATLQSLWNKHEFTNTFKFVGTHIKAFGKVEWNDGMQAKEQHIQTMQRSKTQNQCWGFFEKRIGYTLVFNRIIGVKYGMN